MPFHDISGAPDELKVRINMDVLSYKGLDVAGLYSQLRAFRSMHKETDPERTMSSCTRLDQVRLDLERLIQHRELTLVEVIRHLVAQIP